MEKTKEELSKHFWHRLYKVILWLGSILIGLFMTVVITPQSFWQFSKIFVLFSYFSFLIFFLVYRLILYIAVGGKLFFDKKDRDFFIKIAVVFIVVVGSLLAVSWYKYQKEEKIKNSLNEKSRIAEAAYQSCLDKISALSIWETKPINKTGQIRLYDTFTIEYNQFFDEWKEAGSPNYIQSKGHWEWGVISWMVKNHSDFCGEFNLDLIRYYLGEQSKVTGINYLK